MLYKLGKSEDKFTSIEPVAFKGLPQEKELEDLLATSLWDVLFEDNNLMPLFQERSWQPEADIYALDKQGDLVIFELKREHADGGAVHQVFRYCEKAAPLRYDKLQSMLRKYRTDPTLDLQKEHQRSFDLEHFLEKSAFNLRQHLIIVGSAGDEELIRNVSYWKSQGLSLSFIPYRVYKIGGDQYFEFFSLPFDQHSNPANIKGVIFDTNHSFNPNSIWYMCDNGRVAAFGDQKHIVSYLREGDFVFLYHSWEGIIAAGKVKGKVKSDGDNDALYRDLEWLTSKPTQGTLYKSMPATDIKAELDRSFFWARTIKTPYLSKEQADQLLKALIGRIGPKP